MAAKPAVQRPDALNTRPLRLGDLTEEQKQSFRLLSEKSLNIRGICKRRQRRRRLRAVGKSWRGGKDCRRGAHRRGSDDRPLGCRTILAAKGHRMAVAGGGRRLRWSRFYFSHRRVAVNGREMSEDDIHQATGTRRDSARRPTLARNSRRSTVSGRSQRRDGRVHAGTVDTLTREEEHPACCGGWQMSRWSIGLTSSTWRTRSSPSARWTLIWWTMRKSGMRAGPAPLQGHRLEAGQRGVLGANLKNAHAVLQGDETAHLTS
jgi:hypothetical protein